jgi:hypothetical protein
MNAPQTIRWLLTAGATLIALSFAVPLLLPARNVWTNEKAEAYNLARAQLHNLGQAVSQAGSAQERAELQQKLVATQDAVVEQQAELEGARNRSHLPAWLLRIVGGLLIVTGLVAYARGQHLFGGS